MANRNKIAGSNYEREIVNRLKSTKFFPNVATSRLVSRLRDNQKIDICNCDEDASGRLQYNFQTKTYQNQPNYADVLAEVPTIEGIINVFLHKKTVKKEVANGKKRFFTVGNYAFLTEDDFFKLITDRERYRVAYEILMEYFDSIDDEFKPEVHEALSAIDL
jgi:hypothetical protein